MQRSTRRLAVFALFNCIILNLVLGQIGSPQTSLSYARAFLDPTFHPVDDSWGPMGLAYAQLESGSDTPLYTELFFERHIKFVYPPTSLLLFSVLRNTPFGDLRTAAFLNAVGWWAVLLTALLVWLGYLTSARQAAAGATLFTRPELAALGLIALVATLTFYPIVRSYQLGQMQTWLNALSAALLLAWLCERRVLAGILAGAFCLVKPQLGLLLVWALLRREWRFAGALGATAGLGGLASLALYGLGDHLDYLRVVAFLSRVGEAFHPNQSFNGLLHRLLGNGSNLVWSSHVYPPYHPWVHAGTLVSSALLVGLGLLWRSGPEKKARLLDLSMALLAFTMASPLAWEHHYGILLPIYAVVLPLFTRASPGLLAALAVSYGLTSNLFEGTRALAATPFNFVQSYLLAGALVLLVCLGGLRRGATPPARRAPPAAG